MLQEVTARLGAGGGYFLFLACKNRLQTPMITRQSCKTSDVVMGIPSFHRREQEGPPEWRSHRLPLQAALKDDSFLVPVYHSFQHFAILFAFLTSQANPFLQRKMDLCGIFVGASIARPLPSGRWRASSERASAARPYTDPARIHLLMQKLISLVTSHARLINVILHKI